MADTHFPPQTFVVTTGGKKRKPSVLDPRICLVKPDGTPWQGDPQDVKKGTAVPDTETGDAVTAATVAASLNALLASLRAAGVIAGS